MLIKISVGRYVSNCTCLVSPLNSWQNYDFRIIQNGEHRTASAVIEPVVATDEVWYISK